jgi:hypothetical protein
MKHLVLLIFLSAVAVLRADPVPGVLVWTEADPGGTGNPNGISVEQSCFGSGCGSGAYLDRTFSVTSVGEFVLATSLDASFSGVNCGNFQGCFDYAQAGGNAQADSLIFDTPINVPISESPSSARYCPPPSGCEANAFANGINFQIFNLGLGDYTLRMNYSYVASGGFYPQGDVTFNSLLVPYPTTLFVTPEPRGSIVVLAVAFLALLTLKIKPAGPHC